MISEKLLVKQTFGEFREWLIATAKENPGSINVVNAELLPQDQFIDDVTGSDVNYITLTVRVTEVGPPRP